MSRATRNLVNAAIHISNLQENYLRDVLQNLLASNPSIVLNALETKGFTFEKVEKKAEKKTPEKNTPMLYKIVLTNYNRRMSLIKFVREALGVGLAEAKAWTEGVALRGLNVLDSMEILPAGVFYHGLTYNDAKTRLREMQGQISFKGYDIEISILGDSDSYTSIPPKPL
jgi:ribosomal protein L7/L12